MKKFTAKERKAMIGKTVMWERMLDHNRGYFRSYSGIVEDFKGNNILIDGDWKWFPSLNKFEIKESENGK